MRVISIINHKGGVGKTCSCINLANQIEGKSLIIDVDPQSDASKALGIPPKEAAESSALLFTHSSADIHKVIIPINDGLSIIPSSLELEMSLISLAGKFNYHKLLSKHLSKLQGFDYVFIDCPPSLSVATINGITAAQGIISPVQADSLSVSGLSAVKQLIAETESQADIRLLWTDYDKRNSKMNAWLEHELENRPAFSTRIRTDQHVKKSFLEGQPLQTYAPKCAATEDYQSLALEVSEWVA